MTARCPKCVGDVDRTRQGGLFLFNYFTAAAQAALAAAYRVGALPSLYHLA